MPLLPVSELAGLRKAKIKGSNRPLTARTPNHPGNSTRHGDLIDSGQDVNRRQSNIHEIIAFEVTAANALGLASLPNEEPLDEFSGEEITCFNEGR
ncbi:MAG TPA: hypothetical protein VFD98_00435, partial [Terracidiphilus sp.]|nr:hypothetical protein [Terracidiphilus sp.]